MTPTERTEKLVERVAPIVARALAKRAGLADHRPADAWLNEATVATRSTLDASGIGEMVEALEEARQFVANIMRENNCSFDDFGNFDDPLICRIDAALSRATQSGEG